MMVKSEIFDSLLEPCFLLDSSLNVIYCNETAAIICGISKRKIYRLKFNEILTFSEPISWLENIDTVIEAAPYREVHFKNPEGQEGKVQITCRPLDGEPKSWLIFVRDVTLEERLQKKYKAELQQKEGYIDELKKAQTELEKYNKNLEGMVNERTTQIRELNNLMSALLDSLNQGFFVFDQLGRVLDFSSKACEVTIGQRPNGKSIFDVLSLPKHQVDGFKNWITTLFAEMLPFEDLAPLGPQFFNQASERTIKLEYFPLREDGLIKGIITVATDITQLIEAQTEAEKERENAKMILNLIQRRQSFARFHTEISKLLSSYEDLVTKNPAQWDTEDLFRILHTLKGGFATFNILQPTQLTHKAENHLANFKNEKNEKDLVEIKKLQPQIKHEYEKFIETANSILGEKSLSNVRHVDLSIYEIVELYKNISSAEKTHQGITSLYKSHVLQPVKNLFNDYNNVVQSLTAKLGKKVNEINFIGGDLLVLPEFYSEVTQTLIHCYRNAVDHGIETPEERVQNKKTEIGTISTHFKLNNNRLVIEIIDDGKGISPQKIREKLLKNGTDASKESDEQVIQHIFDASFSTREEITDISGRGVGMDAVKTACLKLNGNCWVESTVGMGSKVTLDLPWYEESQAQDINNSKKLKAS